MLLRSERLDENSNKNSLNIQFMSENAYPNLENNQPLLNNYQPPPPPPPPLRNNPYNAPNPPLQPNPFNNYANPPLNPNPNPYQPQPYRPGYAPYNQPQVVASVGNHQIVSNNGGVYYNPPPPYLPQVYGANPMCPVCRRETSSITRQTPGGVTWIWCFVLFILTGVCCCIPFCVDSCQDTEIVCASCQVIKGRIDANCC